MFHLTKPSNERSGLNRTLLLVVSIMAMLLLAGCASMPLSSMVQLAAMGREGLERVEQRLRRRPLPYRLPRLGHLRIIRSPAQDLGQRHVADRRIVPLQQPIHRVALQGGRPGH